MRYPPTDPGLPAVSPEDVLAEQSSLMTRARRAVGGDDATFDAHVRRPVEALAREVHLLPATACEHFAGPGGLLRQALECAVQCAQSARGRLFTAEKSAQERHALEPRWRRAAFLAGLTCDLSRTLDAIVVCDGSGMEWPKEAMGLSTWLAEGEIARYHVSWLASAARDAASVASPASAALVGRVVTPDVLDWLRRGDPEIASDLLAIAQGLPPRTGSRMASLVDDVRTEVRRVDEARWPCRYGRLRIGHHLEMHLLDAVRTWCERPSCAIPSVTHADDEPRALLVIRHGAAFLRWPEGAQAITQELVGRGLPGIPRASRTLLDCLSSAGLLEARPDGHWVWPLGAGDGGGSAVKFRDGRVLLPVGTTASGPASTEPLATCADEREVDTSTETSDAEKACVDRWRKAWAAEPGCDVLAYEDGRIAVSHRLVSVSHPQPARLLASLRERGWLIEGDGPALGTRVGFVRFRDGQRPAFVLTAEAARQLRLNG